MTKVPYVTAADVEGLLDWRRVADAMAEGHRGPRALITDQFLSRGEDTLLSRAAWVDGLGVGVKSVTVVPGNAARALPTINGAMLVFEDVTGDVRAVIDSGLITRWKTASDSILGARLLARPDPRKLVVVGAGAVAGSLIEAYRAEFPGIEVTLWNRTQARAEELAEAYGAGVAGDLAEAVAGTDIVSCATMSHEPILRGEWLRPGQHVDLIGAFKADMREADDEVLRRSRLFVDSFETTVEHIGELIDPLARGVITRADVLGDLHDLVAGRAGRRSAEDITVFKNGGGAHLDLMTAQVILEAAARHP